MRYSPLCTVCASRHYCCVYVTFGIVRHLHYKTVHQTVHFSNGHTIQLTLSTPKDHLDYSKLTTIERQRLP